MDLRSASREVVFKELKPFLLQAIKVHPAPVDIKLVRGNIVTARDYARRFLISVRKNGIDKIAPDDYLKLKPPIRVYLNSHGITFAGITQKRLENGHWDDYEPPFKLSSGDARWVTLAVDPSASDIKQLASLIVRGVLPSPVEVRTPLTIAAIKSLCPQLHVFKIVKNIMLWPVQGKP